LPLMRSEYFLEIVPGKFTISQDLSEEPTTDSLTTMYGYDCAPSIEMAHVMMAPPNTDHFETMFPKCLDKLCTGNRRESTHEEMTTR